MENCCNSSHDTNNTKKIAERERERERERYVCFYDVFKALFYKLTLKYSDTIEEKSQVKKSNFV